jgi:hypothetical protein
MRPTACESPGHTGPPVPTVAAAAGRAAEICRGTLRLFDQLGFAALPEVTLATGRRLDILALGRDGGLVAVEIKSCRADFLCDVKWPLYLGWADRFFFAVAADFPVEILPDGEGLILADRFGAEIEREARHRPLAGARRRALTLRFARIAAARARGLADPDAALDLPPR